MNWDECYTPEERIACIREHPEDFAFLDFADLLAACRGRYWSGAENQTTNNIEQQDEHTNT